MINQAAFLSVLIITGAASIVVNSVYLPEYPYASAGVACLCIVIYVLVNRNRGCVGSTLMQVADNTYFMGFIFTLIGLVFVLYSIGKNSFQIESVLASAGMAFSTTLVASFLRLLLVQGVLTVDEAGSHAEQALMHATRQYTNALVKSAETLQAGHHEQVQKLNAVFQTSLDTMQNNVAALNDSFVKTLSAFRETAVQTSQQLKNTLDSLSIPEDILVRRLNPVLGQLENSLLNINTALNAYAEDGAKSASTMNVALQATEQFTRDISRLCTELTGTAENVHTETSRVSEVVTGLNDMVDTLGKMSGYLQNTVGMIGSLNSNLQGMSSPVSGISSGLDAVGAKLNDVNREITRLQNKTYSYSAGRGVA